MALAQDKRPYHKLLDLKRLNHSLRCDPSPDYHKFRLRPIPDRDAATPIASWASRSGRSLWVDHPVKLLAATQNSFPSGS